jgi:hypothetical protein
MSNPFKIGDLVVMQRADYWVEYDGMPAVVTAPCAQRRTLDMRTLQRRRVLTYEVKILAEPEKLICARPDQLRPLFGVEPSAEMPTRQKKLLRREAVA